MLGAAALLLFGLIALALWWREAEHRVELPTNTPPPSAATSPTPPPGESPTPAFVPTPSTPQAKAIEPPAQPPSAANVQPPSATSEPIAPRRPRQHSIDAVKPPPSAAEASATPGLAPTRPLEDKPHGRPRPSLGRADF
jgi:type IV secretory pathway VirB10-like protein